MLSLASVYGIYVIIMRADLGSPVHTLKVSNVLIGVFEGWRFKLLLITLFIVGQF